ncbi:MAG: sodium-dependent bicarbonate transport family permease [Candidatus Nanopelagicales bacterium]
MTNTLSIAASNLTSVTVLAFVLGFVAARLKSDIRIPDQVFQFISIYLLLGIGIKGGVAISANGFSEMALPIFTTILLGILIPVLAFFIAPIFIKSDATTRGSLAAHYGSTSLVTFSAALVFLESNAIFYEGYATALMAILEIPGLVVGIFLGSYFTHQKVSWGSSLKEIVLGKTVLLLIGGLLIGYASGSVGYSKVTPFFIDILPGILALFLLNLGYQAGAYIKILRRTGFGLVFFAILFPLLAGVLGAIGGSLIGLSEGGIFVLAILSASASYIAAPAAVSVSFPELKSSVPITASLGITFPFNLIFGIPLLYSLATFL